MRKVWVFVPDDISKNVAAIEADSIDEAQAALRKNKPTFAMVAHYHYPALSFGGEDSEVIIREYHNLENL